MRMSEKCRNDNNNNINNNKNKHNSNYDNPLNSRRTNGGKKLLQIKHIAKNELTADILFFFYAKMAGKMKASWIIVSRSNSD